MDKEEVKAGRRRGARHAPASTMSSATAGCSGTFATGFTDGRQELRTRAGGPASSSKRAEEASSAGNAYITLLTLWLLSFL